METIEILSALGLVAMLFILWPSVKNQLANSRKAESGEWLNVFFLLLGVIGFVFLLISMV